MLRCFADGCTNPATYLVRNDAADGGVVHKLAACDEHETDAHAAISEQSAEGETISSAALAHFDVEDVEREMSDARAAEPSSDPVADWASAMAAGATMQTQGDRIGDTVGGFEMPESVNEVGVPGLDEALPEGDLTGADDTDSTSTDATQSDATTSPAQPETTSAPSTPETTASTPQSEPQPVDANGDPIPTPDATTATTSEPATSTPEQPTAAPKPKGATSKRGGHAKPRG